MKAARLEGGAPRGQTPAAAPAAAPAPVRAPRTRGEGLRASLEETRNELPTPSPATAPAAEGKARSTTRGKSPWSLPLTERKDLAGLCSELRAATRNQEPLVLVARRLDGCSEALSLLVKARRAGSEVWAWVADPATDEATVDGQALAYLVAGGVKTHLVSPEQVEQSLAALPDAFAAPADTETAFLVGGAKIVRVGPRRAEEEGARAEVLTNVEPGSGWEPARSLASVLPATAPLEPTLQVPRASRQDLLAPTRMDTPLEDVVFVVLDTETTGFSPATDDRLLSIGAQAVRLKPDGALEVLEEFDRYARPGRDPSGRPLPIPRQITEVTGIDEQVLVQRNATGIRDVLQDFVGFLQRQESTGPVVLAGQNLPFDLRFLDHTFGREDLGLVDAEGQALSPSVDLPFVDTLALSRAAFPDERLHNLDAIMARLGIPFDESLPRHDSYADVVYTARALAGFVHRSGAKTVGELMGPDVLAPPPAGTDLLPPGGGPARHRFGWSSGKPVLAEVDPISQEAGRGAPLQFLEVTGAEGERLRVSAVLRSGEQQTRVDGELPVSAATFRAPGRTFFELREQGVALPTAQQVRATES